MLASPSFPVIGNIALKFRGFPGVLPSLLHFSISPGWLQCGISQGRSARKERETRGGNIKKKEGDGSVGLCGANQSTADYTGGAGGGMARVCPAEPRLPPQPRAGLRRGGGEPTRGCMYVHRLGGVCMYLLMCLYLRRCSAVAPRGCEGLRWQFLTNSRLPSPSLPLPPF